MPIPVLLTFECGPHNQAGPNNRTLRVIRHLQTNPTRNGIIACFFAQTNAVQSNGHPLRMNSQAGLFAASTAHAGGHVLAVGTGSLEDNHPHRVRANEDPTPPWVGQDGLETDLNRAKAAIERVTGYTPKCVRSMNGFRSEKTERAYRSTGLRPIGFNVDSGDGFLSPSDPLGEMRSNIQADIADQLAAGATFLVVRLRDISRVTAEHLPSILATIENAHAEIELVTSTADAEQILDKMWLKHECIVLRDGSGREILDGQSIRYFGNNGQTRPPVRNVAFGNLWKRTYAFIDGDANMPDLHASLSNSPAFQVDWNIEISYTRSGRNDTDVYPSPPQVPVIQDGSDPWEINPVLLDSVRGGEAVIRVKGTGANQDFEAVRHFHIRAVNPVDADVETYINNVNPPWFAMYVARHESHGRGTNQFYNQFNFSGGYGDGRNDVFYTPNASFDFGFGIYQLTNIYDQHEATRVRAPTAQEIWSWKSNVDTGLFELNRLLTNAIRWMNAPVGTAADITTGSPAYPNGGQRVQAQSQTGAAQPVPNEVVHNVTFQDGTPIPIEHAVTLKMFNGASQGNYCSWNNAGANWQFNRVNNLGFNYVDRVCDGVP